MSSFALTGRHTPLQLCMIMVCPNRSDAIAGSYDRTGSVYSLLYFCCHGFILWCHVSFITRFWVCAWFSCFCVLAACWFMGVSSWHAKIWLSVSSWGLFAWKGSDKIRGTQIKTEILVDTELLRVTLIFFFFFLLLCRSLIRNKAPLLCKPLYGSSSKKDHTHAYTCAASSLQFVRFDMQSCSLSKLPELD